MSDRVTLQMEWSAERAIEASKALYDYEMRHSLKRYIGWIFIAFMQFGIVALYKHQDPTLLLVGSFFVAYWYYGRWYLRRYLIKKYYKKRNLQKSIIEISCNEEALQMGGKELSWDEIVHAIDTNSALLLQTSQEVLYLPYDAFEDIESLSACTQLLKKKGKL